MCGISNIKINGQDFCIKIGDESFIEHDGKEFTDERRPEEITKFKKFMSQFTRDQLIHAFIDIINNGEEG